MSGYSKSPAPVRQSKEAMSRLDEILDSLAVDFNDNSPTFNEITGKDEANRSQRVPDT